MKKPIVIIVVLLLAAGLGLGIRHWWRASRAIGKLPVLLAVMKDEDEPRPIEPSLALQVNEGKEATVSPGTPVWFELNAANEAAMNDVAGTRVLAEKIERLKADAVQGNGRPKELQRALADYRKRTAPSDHHSGRRFASLDGCGAISCPQRPGGREAAVPHTQANWRSERNGQA